MKTLKPDQRTVACLLTQADEILLALKKRGFGQGYWNGSGGKIEPGETPEEAAIRETEEEFCVTPRALEKVANITFNFLPTEAEESWKQHCTVFLVKEWAGQPQETEEMAPRWFKQNEIPYSEMWEADKIWIPLLLAGKKIQAEITFEEKKLISTHIKEI
jgi:mutator protein MutT